MNTVETVESNQFWETLNTTFTHTKSEKHAKFRLARLAEKGWI